MCCRVSQIRRATLVSVAAPLVACVLLLLRAACVEAVVHLAYFEVEDGEDAVVIAWGTGTERMTYGFNLHRATVNDFAQCDQLNEEMIEAKQFGQAVGADYSYLDTDVETGITYYYWLEILDLDGPERRGPEWTTHGPSATATPTSSPTRTPTFTATSLPSSTPTSTATSAPTSTPTGVPSVMPIFTATSLPQVSPSPAARATGASDPSSPASSSATPLPTTNGTAQPLSVSTPAGSQPTATTPSSPGEDGGVLIGWSRFGGAGFSWPFISRGTVLFVVSVTSFLGAVLVLAAYLAIRRLGT